VIEFPIVTEFGPASWPPVPISTDRLVLRESERRDRAAFIELFASPEVGTYLGGSQERSELEREMPETPGRRPGLFVVDFRGAMIGIVTFDRRDSARPGHVRPEADEFELGYMFLQDAWGCGYATEACMAVLDWFASSLPGAPLVLCTQTANVPSMRLAAKLASAKLSGSKSTVPTSGSASGPGLRASEGLVSRDPSPLAWRGRSVGP
jgi:RimJ/RimL family protein N-acetyltransferase